MNTNTRRALAIAACTLASLTASSARADDHGEHHDKSTMTTTTPAGTSSTTTTAAEYDVNAGAERREAGATNPNRTLLVIGGGLFAGSYITSAIIGAANDRDADHRLLIPVAGPWADLADRQCDERPCDQKFWSATLLVTSGVLQAGGLATLIAAFFVPESETPSVLRTRAEAATVRVVPMTMGRVGTGAGIGAVGRF